MRELSSGNRGPVIRTDETTISDDGRDVMTRPEMTPIFVPVESTVESIWRVTSDSMLFLF